MAEGYAKTLGKNFWEVKSAGLLAQTVNPRAIEVMHEVGIDISQQTAKNLSQEMIDWADLIITLCAHADKHCPVIPANKVQKLIQLDDPAQKTGSEEEIIAEFRHVRDEIGEFINTLLRE